MPYTNHHRFLFLIYACIICCGGTFKAIAQPPSILWQHCYGSNITDVGSCISPAINGGFVVAGYAEAPNGDVTAPLHGNADFWMIRIDDAGNILWQSGFGGSGQDLPYAMVSTDKGYVIAGYTNSSDGDITSLHGKPYPNSAEDAWVVATDTAGNLRWQKTFGGTAPDRALAICRTTDETVVIAGYTLSPDGDVTDYKGGGDGWVVKLDDTGGIVWQRTLGTANLDMIQSVKQTMDGGYIVAGWSNSDSVNIYGATDGWVVKLDDTGGMVWQQFFGGSNGDVVQSILQTPDSGYVVAGHTKSADGAIPYNHGGYDYWVTRLNSAGKVQWSKTYGGGRDDEVEKIIPTLDGNYMVAGFSYSHDGDVTGSPDSANAWMVLLNDTGAIIWQKAIGGSNADYASDIVQAPDSSFIIAGNTHSNDGDVSGNHGQSDYWVVKLGNPLKTEISFVPITPALSLFPNPCTNILTITSAEKICEVSIRDLWGQTLCNHTFNTEQVTVSVADLQPGMYFIRINGSAIRKFVKE